MTDITPEFVKPYFDGKKRHQNYDKALDIYHHLTFHFDGYFRRPWMSGTSQPANLQQVNPYFSRLIDNRRPSESDVILDYRRDRYFPKTKAPCSKIQNSLRKIVKSSDWKIDWSKVEVPKSLPEKDQLNEYTEENYPFDDCIENWAYNSMVRWLLIDPNGLICVFPLSWEVEENEYVRPYAHIIPCKDVLDYKQNELAIFISPYTIPIKDANGRDKQGKIIMIVTTDTYYECRQKGGENNGTYNFDIIPHPHNIGELPAFIIGGLKKNPEITAPFYESFVMDILPSLDTVAADLSDLEAEKAQHLFSTMWYIQPQACSACQGSGGVLAEGKQTICPSCEGRGVLAKSPFKDLMINASNPLQSGKDVPIPPAGYITKPIEMVELQMKIIKDGIYDALSAINMEFLAQEPLNVSGKAKEVDRDELNNFVYSIAYHLVENIIVPIYYFVNELRYMNIVPDPELRKKMLPHINVPEVFDFLADKNIEDRLIKVSGSDVSAEIKELIEMNYIHSEFQDVPETRDKLIALHNHDPFAGQNVADLESMLTSGVISKTDFILHIYIKNFISELLSDDSEFLQLDFDEQKTKLYEMAAEKEKELDAAEKIKRDAQIKAMQRIKDSIPKLGQPAGTPAKIKVKQTGLPGRKKERNDLEYS